MNPDKPSFEQTIVGLTTKSEKIRKLAQAGYLRTEIAELLGIRYQHVRKVLEDAGINLGRQREVAFERDPVEVIVEDLPATETSWETLLRAGFSFLGEWTAESDGEFRLDAKAPTDAGVYAFIVDDVVKYVGLTQRGLRSRLDGYRRGHERQRTNARVKGLINAALVAGKRVKILVATPEPQTWKGLPVNTAAGLEAGLIGQIRPEWNILGAS